MQLVDLLAEEGSIDRDKLAQMVELARREGGSLVDRLIVCGLLNEHDAFFLLSRRLGVVAIPDERLLHVQPEVALLERVPHGFARRMLVLPLDQVAGGTSVAMVDPSDPVALSALRDECGLSEIRPYLARRSALAAAIERVYVAFERTPPPVELMGAPEPGEYTHVALIPGKVELDGGMAREIAAMGGEAMISANVDEEELGEREVTAVRAVRRPPSNAESDAMHIPARSLLDDAQGPDWEVAEPTEAQASQRVISSVEILSEADQSEVTSVDLLAVASADDESLLGRPTVTMVRFPAVESLHVDGDTASAIGALTSMLEERIDPGSALCREYARLARRLARGMGLADDDVERTTLAAYLVGLDAVLRRELSLPMVIDVVNVFEQSPTVAGGLNPTLRRLGARSLELPVDDLASPAGIRLEILRLVCGYLDLQAESSAQGADGETVMQLLGAGRSPELVDAFCRIIESDESTEKTTKSRIRS
ncbi:MAG: hypothetical protein H6707_16255 [Deltaproteobacteria bacterium]|nr:hypothetical protein [Deltaproteobacteria bacterium]